MWAEEGWGECMTDVLAAPPPPLVEKLLPDDPHPQPTFLSPSFSVLFFSF